jgi:prepilin-type N-terminal cleavage/methylation domain-containing protein
MNRPALRLAQAKTRTAVARKALTSNGFTMIELVVVLAVGMVLTAMAVPVVQSTLLNLRLQSAAGSVSSAIQTTRYQSIQQGYQYKLTLTKSTATYQLASKPGAAASFSDIGSAIPFAKTDVVLNANPDPDAKRTNQNNHGVLLWANQYYLEEAGTASL